MEDKVKRILPKNGIFGGVKYRVTADLRYVNLSKNRKMANILDRMTVLCYNFYKNVTIERFT